MSFDDGSSELCFTRSIYRGFWRCLSHTGSEQAYKIWYAVEFQLLLTFFTQYEFLILYNTWVLMMDPLNYALGDQSIEVFDGALATQGLNKPLENDMLLLTCFTQYEFLMLYSTWFLMMDPLNYASVKASYKGFWWCLSHTWSEQAYKIGKLLNISCYLPSYTIWIITAL